jgi:hypothetical protein
VLDGRLHRHVRAESDAVRGQRRADVHVERELGQRIDVRESDLLPGGVPGRVRARADGLQWQHDADVRLDGQLGEPDDVRAADAELPERLVRLHRDAVQRNDVLDASGHEQLQRVRRQVQRDQRFERELQRDDLLVYVQRERLRLQQGDSAGPRWLRVLDPKLLRDGLPDHAR